ncbi:MAG: TetR/AcrR family transcriptional regulator [Mycobacteriales bacterium]
MPEHDDPQHGGPHDDRPHDDRPQGDRPHDGVPIPAYLRELWYGGDSGRSGAQRGPKRSIDIHAIGAASVRLADRSGLGAVSMRAVATALGVTTMALYRYVASKDELVKVMFDAAYGAPPLEHSTSSSWRPRMAAWAHANRTALLAHPWLLQVPIDEPPLQPSQIAWMEQGLDALAATGLDEQVKLSSMLLVDVYVRGQTQLALGFEAGDTDDDPGVLYARRLAALVDPERFPRIADALFSGALEDDDSDFATDEFAFGLDTILDGIGARIAARR